MDNTKFWSITDRRLLIIFISTLIILAIATLPSNTEQLVGKNRSKRCDECAHNAISINQTFVDNNTVAINFSDPVKIPIDWYEVEANFNKVLTEDEVFQKWDTMEANMKSGLFRMFSLPLETCANVDLLNFVITLAVFFSSSHNDNYDCYT